MDFVIKNGVMIPKLDLSWLDEEDHLRPDEEPGVGWDIEVECAPCATPEEISLPSPTLSFVLTNEPLSSKLLYNQNAPLTAAEQLSDLEQKVKQMTAQNSQMVASIENDQLVKEGLTSVAEQWSSFLKLKDKELKDEDREFHGLSLVKETSIAQLYREVLMKGKASHLAQVAPKEVERLQEELKETKNETENLQVKLRMMEDSLQKGHTRLIQLKESNSKSAQEMEETRLNIESLKETQEVLDKELNDVRLKRLEKKCHNGKLKEENSRLFAQQMRHTLETVGLRRELESAGNELRAAMRANQTLRREAKRREGKLRRLRRWFGRRFAPILRA